MRNDTEVGNPILICSSQPHGSRNPIRFVACIGAHLPCGDAMSDQHRLCGSHGGCERLACTGQGN